MPSIIRFSSSTVVFSFASKKMVILRRRIIRKISHILPSVETTACDRQTCGLVGPGPPKTGGLFRALLRRLRAQSGQPRVRHRDQKRSFFFSAVRRKRLRSFSCFCEKLPFSSNADDHEKLLFPRRKLARLCQVSKKFLSYKMVRPSG